MNQIREAQLYLLLFVTATVVSALLTPLFRWFALRTMKFVQRPRAISIETHVQPTPVGGGLAIYLGGLGALWLAQPWSGLEQRVMLAGAVLVIFGLLDDSRNLSLPTGLGKFLEKFLLDNKALSTFAKFIPQFLAAYLVLAPGSENELVTPYLFDYEVANQVVAILWIVGIINAINFLDIMDGLAAGTSMVAAIGFFLLGKVIGHEPAFVALAIVLAGGALGFLFYNFQPASIFMGDTGSQFLGLVLGVLALIAAGSATSFDGMLPPLILLGIPLFEITYTMTIRVLTGKLPWKGSKDHTPLRMFQLGFSVRQIVLSAYIAGLALILCALWLVQASMFGRLIGVILLGLVAMGIGLWLSQVKVPKLAPQREQVKGFGPTDQLLEGEIAKKPKEGEA